jgi:hypothetical protein
MEIKPLNTGLTDEQVLSAFTKALASASSEDLNAVQSTVTSVITALMTAGKTLGENSDLNEEKDIGHFQCAATNANSCKNRPLDQITGGFGGFNVPLFGERLLQFVAYNTITGQATGRLFMRFLYSSGWTLWNEFNLTEIPAPASAQSVGGDANA